MPIITIANQKGGVSKTTVTHNLARGLGGKVLIVDFDPQTNLSRDRFGVDIEKFSYNVVDFLKLDKSDAEWRLYLDSTSKIELMVGSEELNAGDWKKDSLKKSFKELAGYGIEYDYILIDCPPKPTHPKYNTLTEMAMIASDYLLSPLEVSTDSMSGLGNILDSFIRIRNESNHKLEFLGFFFNKVESNTIRFRKHHEELLESDFNDYYIQDYIRKDEAIYGANDKNMSVIDFSPKARASQDFKKLAKTIKKSIKQ